MRHNNGQRAFWREMATIRGPPPMSADILPFHVRALSSSKASNGRRPLDRLMIGNRHLCGTLPRSRHFSNALEDTPSARASFSSSSQSNVVAMSAAYSYKKSEVKRLLPGRRKSSELLSWDMPKSQDNEELAIRARIKPALRSYRESRGWSQREMAKFLQVTLKNYEAYESKPERGVPAGIISRFCIFSGADIEWIMLGKKPLQRTG